MELIRGIHNLRTQHRGCVATIGNFDGVHLGHQKILQQVREKAAQLGEPATVMVFEPQPREFFAGDQAPARLTRFREKVERLAEYGAERIVCLQFNSRLRQLTGEEFIQQVLVDGLGVRHLVVGDDFRFGCDRAGDFHLLEKLGPRKGFGVEHTHTFLMDEERVSSTRVRTTLASANLAGAARMLGRPYKIASRVVHGRKLGRTLGVPTANLLLGIRKPALNGVFTVLARLKNGDFWPGVANIGLRPTVDGVLPALEVHLHGFREEIYAQPLEVFFLAKLRNEKKFSGLEELKENIALDIDHSIQFFNQAHPDWVPGSAWPDHEIQPLLATAPLTFPANQP
ncbi:bifunctional riboflavin kinase/FAD synthetase [Marinospirillum sp.]|uniref:bifunctional riboflavin kinase/FAD synthetase n=1 Tax=Marinospirillum sp. TaxID=2183934 RepID=UPI002870740A|nr:bifunctional riboflavin kinase/FAD synthetase [Marinospirillum sp.]MDR9466829.1 bifunctional riboflavin kinase/FAD synthetase [Marinospirillum sp.]